MAVAEYHDVPRMISASGTTSSQYTSVGWSCTQKSPRAVRGNVTSDVDVDLS